MAGALRAFLLLAALLLAGAAPVLAQASPLEFLGFRAGAPLHEIAAWVREHNGTRLACDRSRSDPRVQDCRARLNDPITGESVELWASVIDSSAGVLTISGAIRGELLDRWRRSLERRYGRVGATAQGTQWMMQWVRQGRMIRLTWRTERGGQVASVSLVDGHVLDGWGRHSADTHP